MHTLITHAYISYINALLHAYIHVKMCVYIHVHTRPYANVHMCYVCIYNSVVLCMPVTVDHVSYHGNAYMHVFDPACIRISIYTHIYVHT